MRRPKLALLLVVLGFLGAALVLRSRRHRSNGGDNQDNKLQWVVSRQKEMKEELARADEEEQPRQQRDPTAFLAEMYRRSLHVYEECEAGVSAVRHTEVRNFVVPDEVQSLLFCPIYKAASSTWLMAMLQMRGFWGPSHAPEQLNDVRRSVYSKLTGFIPSEQSEQFRTRFLVVRHPLERLLSCYRDKFEDGGKPYYYAVYGKKMLRMFRKTPSNVSRGELNSLLVKVDDDPEGERTLGNPYANPVGPTFTEFVKYVVSRYSDDKHWRPFHVHCAPCSIQYNFILRFEDLAEEGDQFLQYLQTCSSGTNPTLKMPSLPTGIM